jgi:hypothetical protein
MGKGMIEHQRQSRSSVRAGVSRGVRRRALSRRAASTSPANLYPRQDERLHPAGGGIGQQSGTTSRTSSSTPRSTLDTTPRYEALDEKGPDHSKCFEVAVVINSRRVSQRLGAE